MYQADRYIAVLLYMRIQLHNEYNGLDNMYRYKLEHSGTCHKV